VNPGINNNVGVVGGGGIGGARVIIEPGFNQGESIEIFEIVSRSVDDVLSL
jgi:hypothetical protein